ncbi:MAG: AAA family ATPase [Candidatus Thermoplasmatota archaeon]
MAIGIDNIDRAINYLSQHISELPKRVERNIRSPTQTLLPQRSVMGRLRKCIDEFLLAKEQKKWYIMPGLRGTGKTTVLYQIYAYLHEKNQHVLYLTCDELQLHGFTLKEMLEIYEKSYLPTRFSSLESPLFLLVDEVHFDKEWDLTLKVLYDKASKIFIIASGSSSLAIQTPDATRRSLRIDVIPMTLQEYIMLTQNIHAKYRTAELIRRGLFLSRSAGEAAVQLESIYKQLRDTYFSKFDVEKEITQYLRVGGFPYTLQMRDEKEVFENLYQTLSRVVRDDLPQVQGISREILSYVFPVLYAIVHSGRVSYQTIAETYHGLKGKDVFNIIHGLASAGVLFSLRPMGSIAKVGKGGLTHYLVSSTLKATLLHRHGLSRHTSYIYGQLLENAVAAHLYKNKLFTPEISEVTFDPRDGGANFVVFTQNNKIAVECGWKKESLRQVEFTLSDLRKEMRNAYGIVVTTEKSCKAIGNVLFAPKELFFLS